MRSAPSQTGIELLYLTGAWHVSDLCFSGPQLYQDLVAAIEQRDKQREFFAEFNSTIPSEVSREWEQLVQDFEEDPTGPNPYEEIETGKSYLEKLYRLTNYISRQRLPLKTFNLNSPKRKWRKSHAASCPCTKPPQVCSWRQALSWRNNSKFHLWNSNSDLFS